MPGYPVDVEELQVMGNHFTTVNYPYFEELREAFRLLRLTGCRISEIFEISRWSIISGYTVQLQPQKGNNPRTIILDPTFNNFLNAIAGQYKPFLGRSSFQLQYIFSKINIYGPIYSGTKEITNYFFRYLFVRELNADGLTFEQIADVMGYTSTTAVNNYLNAVLVSTNEVPVTPPEPIIQPVVPIISVPQLFVAGNSPVVVDEPFSWHKISIHLKAQPTITGTQTIIFPYYTLFEQFGIHVRYAKSGTSHYVRFYVNSRGADLNYLHSWNYNINAISNMFLLYDFTLTGTAPNIILQGTTTWYISSLHSNTKIHAPLTINYPFVPKLLALGKKTWNTEPTLTFLGTIHKLTIYNKLLSLSEIQALDI